MTDDVLKWMFQAAPGIDTQSPRPPSVAPLDRAKWEENDLSNARRLAAVYGEDIIYMAGRGWAVWNGACYSFEAGEVGAQEIASRLPDIIKEEADAARQEEISDFIAQGHLDRELKKDKPRFTNLEDARRGLLTDNYIRLMKHATKCGNTGKIDSALKLLRQLVRVKMDDLDADPGRLNCANGTLDLMGLVTAEFTDLEPDQELAARRGFLLPHDRAYRPTKVARVQYDPTATAPHWDVFIELIMPDPEVRAFLQRALGMVLYGRNPAQVILMMRGGGGNGKSTLMNTIYHVLGTYAAPCKVAMVLEGQPENPGAPTPHELDLPGARLMMMSEPKATDRLASDKIKAFTGGDPRPLRAGYEKGQVFYRPTGVPALSFNRTPRIMGEDEGTRRRLVFIPFEVSLHKLPKDKRRDQDEVEAELKAEASGILNWMISGFIEFRSRGLDIPAKSDTLKADILSAADPVGEFIAACCVTDADNLILKRHFYGVFQAWCAETTAAEFSQRAINAIMPEKGYPQKKTGGGLLYWRGLKWSDDPAVQDLLRKADVNPPTEKDPRNGEDEVPL